jgi:hypothetical protein
MWEEKVAVIRVGKVKCCHPYGLWDYVHGLGMICLFRFVGSGVLAYCVFRNPVSSELKNAWSCTSIILMVHCLIECVGSGNTAHVQYGKW